MKNSGLNEECGVFGIINDKEASKNIYLGLHMLQHRGQDGAGIITYDEQINKYFKHKDFGLVSQVFPQNILDKLSGTNGIGHVRYATSGGNEIENIQPFLFYTSSLSFSLCHNGNIINSKQVKKFLEEKGSIFQSNSDSEVLAHLIMQNFKGNMVEAIKKSLNFLDGAFAFLILYQDKIIACKDKYGLRPLALGKTKDGYVLASETCAFDLINAKFIKELESGEVLEVSKDGFKEHFYSQNTVSKICAMEYIYFSRPDSDLLHKNVHQVRYETGIALAQETNICADIVIGVPDSSLSAAQGYASESNIPLNTGLIKHKYIGRTFIEPTQVLRENSVRLKLNVIRETVKDKNIILVDDSIVRGTTSKKIVSLLKEAGALKVHVVIASPAIIDVCFYGVDIHSKEELIANQRTSEEIREYIGADSLYYLSLDGLKNVLGNQDICHGCFDRIYPTYIYEKEERSNRE